MNKNALRSISEKGTPKSKLKGTYFLYALWLIFFCIGAAMLYPFAVKPILEMRDSENWIPTTCIVLSSQVREHEGSGDSGPTYSVDISYSYNVGGRELKSDRYQIFEGSSSGYRGKQEVVRQYPKGREFTCYYNPQNPAQAVIIPGFSWGALIGLLPVVFLLIGAGGAFFTYKTARSVSREELMRRDPWQAREAGAGVSVDLQSSYTSGSRVLKPKYSQMGKFVGALLFAAFWNGIVIFPLNELFESWQKGSFEWFMAVFMVPFVLIGAAALLSVPYFFLGLFNPRPEITLSPGEPSLGDALQVSWQCEGKASRIRRFLITLEGTEEATYRRGTSTYTDRETFKTVEIKVATLLPEIRCGSAQLRMPADTMHSLEAERNKIVWMLKVHGEIAWWPDVSDTFPVTVHPMRDMKKERVWTS